MVSHMAADTPTRRTRARGAGKATLVLHEKVVLADESIIELVVWRLPSPAADRPHGIKYRLYYGRGGVCLVRYDNEAGKGDHRHFEGRETRYEFSSIAQLRRDFEVDVRNAGGKIEEGD
jgi:hypothetical protein